MAFDVTNIGSFNLHDYYMSFSGTSETAKAVSAETQVQAHTLGATLPFVIGTGRVDGHYFIGGISTITSTTITSEIVDAGTPYDYLGIRRLSSSSSGTGGQTYTSSLQGTPHVYKTVETETVTTETVARAGYILAYDPFERGYDLIRLEVDDRIVYDAETGIGSSTEFRFYGGRQTAVDDILSDIIGANAGAYQNFVYVILDGYDADTPPRVSAVISNAASAQPSNAEIEWTSTVPNTFDDQSDMAAYDQSSALIYQLLTQDDIPSLSDVYLAVLDLNTKEERYRVVLEDSGAFVGQEQYILALPGSGHVMVKFEVTGTRSYRIYNANTGALVADADGDDDVSITDDNIQWIGQGRLDERFVFLGRNLQTTGAHPTASYLGIVDLARGTLDVTVDTTREFISVVCTGRNRTGTVSFFGRDGSTGLGGPTDLYELTFDGLTVTWDLVATVADNVYAIHYDSLTGYLVVSTTDGSPGTTHSLVYYNPDSGLSIDTFTTTYLMESQGAVTAPSVHAPSRFFPDLGYALFKRVGSYEVYLLDIRQKTLSLLLTIPTVYIDDVQDVYASFIDHGRRVYYTSHGDDIWTERALPNISPGLVDLDDVITDVASLAGFGPSDLTFEGFTGTQTYGFVINSDTTVQNVLKGLSDVFDFTFCDTGSGFFFKKAGRDGSLSIDVALTTADLVERAGGAVQSRDEANLRTPAAVELEYVSKNSGYKPLSAPFSMPTGVLNSIRTEKMSTPVVLTDAMGQQFATEKFFEFQKRRREHNVIVAPEHIDALPGDIITFPSGLITYTARIEQMAIELRTMAVEISARDFQTEVSTTITAVSNNGGVAQIVSFATQYIHLDVPLFKYSDDLDGTALVQYGVIAPRGQNNWTGGVLYRGDTPLGLSPIIDQAPHNGTIGICTTVLGNPLDPFGTTDTSTVTVRRTSGSGSLLASKTQAQVEAGQNNAFIGQAGRWEWVGFTTVTDNGDDTYALSGFVRRGYRGTEVFCDEHAVNDIFVLIDEEWLRKMPHPTSDLDQTRYYKALGTGQKTLAGTTLPHVVRGAAETPYATTNLFAALGGSPGGIDIEWDYRSRVAAGTNPSNHGEASLSFEIDIMDGATVKRTLTSTTNSVNYSDAQVIADWGSYPSSLTFRVYMMSAVVGRGYRAQATIPLTYDLTADTTVILADSTLITADQE
ncbi:hypothetical protein MesoLjLc_50470 [Mesorhizobium sp. L-8-10]|uniref:phage tail protein n=1 Tax=Mesorhizobium sp. L-8-10 TaxID=2744523 RepID=UPI001928B8D4|nr:phage tail protein [Mesorhizobium sp. L-8-10]BCH33117.1 hypothetical protein MesoLjLc_50470 [Mesorhizobium sp. L-8-10]